LEPWWKVIFFHFSHCCSRPASKNSVVFRFSTFHSYNNIKMINLNIFTDLALSLLRGL
jgi:hypothetical protein